MPVEVLSVQIDFVAELESYVDKTVLLSQLHQLTALQLASANVEIAIPPHCLLHATLGFSTKSQTN